MEKFSFQDKKSKNYFEGWYFKLVNHDGSEALAIIPGIAMDEQGNKQAFIQVLDGKRKSARYHKFVFEDFILKKIQTALKSCIDFRAGST